MLTKNIDARTVKTFNSLADVPPGILICYVCGMVDDKLEIIGDVALFSYRHITVTNYWDVITQYCDSRDDAMRYIKGRMCPNPVFVLM